MDLTNLNKDRKRRKPAIDVSTMIYGKIPPQARDVEQAVLGAILLERSAMDIAIEILTPDCFYVGAHQLIFKAMQLLAQKSQPIDLLTVVEQLRSSEHLEKIGGPYYVAQLTNSVTSAANLTSHCRIILEKYMKREIIRVGGQMVMDGYEDSIDVFNLLDESETSLMAVTVNNLKKDYRGIDAGLVKVIQKIEHMRHLESPVMGVPSGFRKLDKCTGGWQDTDLIIIAARPSVGKTAFALNLAANAALDPEKRTPVGFFCLEMSESQLIERVLAAKSNIHLERIRKGRFDEPGMKELYEKGVQPLSQAPIFFDDTPGLSLFELRAKARRMKNKHGVGLIIVDYLQLMSVGTEERLTREQQVAKISRELKKLAKEIELPIIALSQMSRDIEGKNREPQLSDLRESGAIEQDADLVMFLYQPSKQDVQKDPELRNKGMIKIAKHRNGQLEDFTMRWEGWVQKWTEIEDLPQQAGNWKPVDLPKNARLFTEPEKKTLDEEDMPF
jgi:replicative DNA helicase